MVYGDRTAWSVVVKGRAHEVERMREYLEAEELPLFPWVASPKPAFVRITPAAVTGRRFHVIDEITPDDSLGWHDGQQGAAPEREVAVEPDADTEYHPGEPYLRPD